MRCVQVMMTARRRSCTGGSRGTARWRCVPPCIRAHSLAHAPQVMESDHKDTVSVLTINSKCKVHTLEEYLAIAKEARDNPAEQLIPVARAPSHHTAHAAQEFMSRSYYLHKKKKFQKDLPLYCTCRKPFNPDKMLVCCEACKQWFHAVWSGSRTPPSTCHFSQHKTLRDGGHGHGALRV